MRPDGSSAKTIFKEFGIDDYLANSAETFTGGDDVNDAFNLLMQSSSHRAILLSNEGQYIGLAMFDEIEYNFDSYVQVLVRFK